MLSWARNPNNFKQKTIVFTGKIIQTIESKKNFLLRVNVTKGKLGNWEDTVFVNYQKAENESRILENDIITLWGTVKGLTAYKTIVGTEVALPEIDAKYLIIEGNEK